ncbi:diguanylate cyclase [Lactobacillus gasseri]|uniref:diguanylate cyclase n=1 Tax=Lactobacillus gasseri TaxID=1596 RepID=UPI00254AC995|nr:diguanylate cyclase [Lactobacillus gasseri]MDK6500582.1 diguanylate cyclase [Lactobacillus gasseri]
MKNINEIVIGKPVKISRVLIGAAAIVILSLFVTGFSYLPWWVFIIVLTLKFLLLYRHISILIGGLIRKK